MPAAAQQQQLANYLLPEISCGDPEPQPELSEDDAPVSGSRAVVVRKLLSPADIEVLLEAEQTWPHMCELADSCGG